MSPAAGDLLGYPDFPLPDLEEAIELNLKLGAPTNPAIRCAGRQLQHLGTDVRSAQAVMDEPRDRLGLPVADPMRGGEAFERLVTACLQG